MQAFVHLIETLDHCRGSGERVEAMAAYFAAADPADAAWALQVLLGKRRRRLITGRRLRQICLEASGLPEWLFDACHSQVGDSAETVALLWPGEAATEPAEPAGDEACLAIEVVHAADQPLHGWMEQLLPAAAALEGEEQAAAVRRLWRGLDPQQQLVAGKLLTGGLRVGVAQGLVVRALARCSGLEEAVLQHRLMGAFTPSAAAWKALLAPTEDGQAVASRPYPFFLASPLQPDPQATAPLPGAPGDWLVEWKWDGIRGQLIHRGGDSFLWSRGEELIHEAFPELLQAAATLPEGTVLDGEVLVWRPGEPCPAAFAELQRRLGRKRPGRRLLAECPAVLLAYDLLEWGGEDLREQPLSRRRSLLESLLRELIPATASPAAGPLSPALQRPDAVPTGPAPAAGAMERKRTISAPSAPAATALGLSPGRPLASWEELEELRQAAAGVNAEGLMLKALDSPYRAGRRRGAWWKHKRDPHRLDAVLLYAQAGSGRRANLFTDYTFGLWDRSPAPAEPVADQGALAGEPSAAPRLVSFAKAYSGLDDAEILELDRWIRSHTTERFGPVRAVQPLQVFELAFEGLQRSSRHKSGIAVRFPRISRWRRDKPAAEADTLPAALALLEQTGEKGMGR